MDVARWETVQRIFHDALTCPEPDRGHFLDAACGADLALRAEVRRLIEADGRNTLLDAATADVARAVVGSAAPTDLAGARIGPYRLSRKLGEGGSGVVYLADRDDIGSQAAIKILRDAWVSPSRRDRFLAEQRTLAKLSHPGIAPIVDAGVDGGVPWFAMEYVRGLPLDDYCRDHALDLHSRVRLLRRVCSAVQYAHERLFVHRDLKPSNILVLPDGSPKLLDFGIARHLADVDAAQATVGPLRFLTPSYAAPEELRGEPSGVQADVYSLGVMLRQLGADAVRPSARRGKAFAALCAMATAVETDDRYASVEALGRDLDAFLEGFPVTAYPGGVTYRAATFLGRHRRAVVAAAAVVVAIAGLTGYYGQRLAAAQAETRAESARAGRLLHFVLNLFDGGDTSGAPAADLRVVSLLDRGVNEARGLSADRAVQGELFQTLGGIYQQLGDLERAGTLLTDALTARRAAVPYRADDEVRALLSLADLEIARSRLDAAAGVLAEADAIATRSAGIPETLQAQRLLVRGRLERDKGDYPAAGLTLEAAARRFERVTDGETGLTDTLTALSEVRFYQGDLAAAGRLNEQALAGIRRARGGSHPDIAHALLTRGAILAGDAKTAEAERVYREALAIFTTWYGPAHPETASAMTILAQALGQQERYEEGVPLLRQALDVQARVFGPRHPRTAFVQNALGLMAFRMSDLAAAAAAFARAAEGYHGAAGTHFQEGVSIANLGSVLLAQGHDVDAERRFQDALAIYAEVLPPDHLNIAVTRSKLGRALVRQRRFAEAGQALTAARAVLERQPGEPSSWLKATREDLATIAGQAGTR